MRDSWTIASKVRFVLLALLHAGCVLGDSSTERDEPADDGKADDSGDSAALEPMPGARAHAGAVAGDDGRIYVFGGVATYQRLFAALDVMEVYDPTSGEWSLAAPMPSARHCMAAVATDLGQVIVIGGEHEEQFLDVVEIYDIATNSWTAGPRLDKERMGGGAVFCGGELYAVGGDPEATIERYHPGGWELVDTAMPTPRTDMQAVCVDDRIYVIGGIAGEGWTGAVESWDPKGGWRSEPALPEPLKLPVAATDLDGNIHVINENATYEFDRETQAWTSPGERQHMPTPRHGTAFTRGSGDDPHLYAIGGDDHARKQVSAALEVLDPRTQSWSTSEAD